MKYRIPRRGSDLKSCLNIFLKYSMQNKAILAALASDLKRVSLGLHRGALGMADRFSQEALRRRGEINDATVAAYIVRLLADLEGVLRQNDNTRKAEDALMYSTLFQNYVVRRV